jgi:hypothetical protein
MGINMNFCLFLNFVNLSAKFKIIYLFFLCFDTLIAFPGTVISQHSSFALHSPFRYDGLRFHVLQLENMCTVGIKVLCSNSHVTHVLY